MASAGSSAPTPDARSTITDTTRETRSTSSRSSQRRTRYTANTFFRDDQLFVPGYQFAKAQRWEDVGSTTLIAQGVNLKDSTNVFAKLAPTHTAGALCLDREFNILRLLGQDQEALGKVLRVVDYFSTPRQNGDMVVLLLSHPGENVISQYFPPSKLNAVLFPTKRQQYDDEDGDERSGTTTIELVTFLEFAVQATQCLEAVHNKGLIHREVRLNAFHYSPAGRVRLVHFGNRSTSLESLGGPSGLVLQSEDRDWSKVKEAISYLPPEQINNSATIVDREDHRTDLYALGIVLFILLTGHGTLPFEGGVREFVSVVRQQRPLRIHEVRRDVPKVISDIIDKLLSKDPEERYSSAMGLKHDFLQCQKWLNIASTTSQSLSAELIPRFELGRQDKYLEFTMPHSLFGREREVETIHAVIRAAASGGGSQFSGSRHSLAASSVSTLLPGYGGGAYDEPDSEDDHSGRSDSTNSLPPGATLYMNHSAKRTPVPEADSLIPLGGTAATLSGENMRRVGKAGARGTRVSSRFMAVIVQGPGGMGKSSVVMEAMPYWRQEGGLWGAGKCSHADSTPYGPVFSCLSSVLQQFSSVYSDETFEFVEKLRHRLGSNLPNIQLLFDASPELKGILALHDITKFTEIHSNSTVELRARFIDLMVDVFATCADIRHLALFFDDLHNANESTLEVISALASSKLRILLFGTVRSESDVRLERIRKVFSKNVRSTWLELHPLSMDAMSAFVSQALRVAPDTCTSMTKLVHRISRGSPFAARNLLTALRRQNYIYFDWEGNHWLYNIELIENKFISEHFSKSDPGDVEFLVARMREFPEVLQRYIVWGCFFGPAFKITDVAMMMDWEEGNGSNDDSDSDEPLKGSRGSMQGLQLALAEGWLVHRGRETCAFSHDRFRQAAVAYTDQMPQDVVMNMNLRIALVLLTSLGVDGGFRIADFAKRCIPLITTHPKRLQFLDIFLNVSQQATVQGAHEMALEYCECARQLLDGDAWNEENRGTTLPLLMKTADLLTWSGENGRSDDILQEILEKTVSPMEAGHVCQLQARNCWKRNDFKGGLGRTLHGLRILGIDINEDVSEKEVDEQFNKVRGEILERGFESILKLPTCTDATVELTVSLLNDASTNASWSQGESFADLVGLKNIEIALSKGLSTGSPGGFMWALGVAAEQKCLFRFALDMGKLAMEISARHSGVGDRAKYEIMYISQVSGYDLDHIRVNIPRAESALRLSRAAGDRIYASFSTLYNIQTQLFICRHLSELVATCEEAYADVTTWISGNNTEILVMSVLMCARALGGYTINASIGTAFDNDEFTEFSYLKNVVSRSANVPFVLNWYNTYKVVALYCLGYYKEAADLGFQVYESRQWHPNYRHVRFGLTYHSLAMIQCLRDNSIPPQQRVQFLDQIDNNQAYVKKWVDIAPKNTLMWTSLVDAELASLSQGADALKLYDVAIRSASDNEWIMEEGWALYLAGSHFIRCGMMSFGAELQRRGIARQSHWGALGIVTTMEATSQKSDVAFRRAFTADAGTQTDRIDLPAPTSYLNPRTLAPGGGGDIGEQDLSHLSADEFAQIIKWTQEISSEINLSSSLEKLTEYMAKSSGAEKVLVTIRDENGTYAVCTSLEHPEPCQVFDTPYPISEIREILALQVIQQVIHSKEPAYQRDAAEDPRYSAAAVQSSDRAILCFPIYNQSVADVLGCIYLSSSRPYSFQSSTITMLGVLAQQASISITNALLFRSVQNATRQNMRMIALQKEALEDARKSREEALKAAKTKSNFLASMSHELRTPFSSFYGLLDLLSSTELDWEQRELVQTARQSCELLLEIIDGLLDYSKLEAAAVKLESIPVHVEDLVGNAVELLTHLAVKRGLDLSFYVEPDVPFYILGDHSRLQQVLMNLLGNALKFTEEGSVKAICLLDKSGDLQCGENQVVLKWTVIDTGIGMSAQDMKNLWQPFSQVDQSTTRKFGGTGLGLSICLSLVKLMHGDVGVTSVLGEGSQFWFRIPVTVHESPDTLKEKALLDSIRQSLTSGGAKVLLASPSETTRDLLSAAIAGVNTVKVTSTSEAEGYLQTIGSQGGSLHFIVVDEQAERRVDDMANILQNFPPLGRARIIHLCVPSADFMNRRPAIRQGQARADGSNELPSYVHGGYIVRMTKPARTERFLKLLSRLWESRNSDGEFTLDGNSLHSPTEAARREGQPVSGIAQPPSPHYAGNVLIAEDNPIAQQLLVRQLQRHGLSVTATNNGEEAIKAWDEAPQGHFKAALFDNHMPVLDGVEATKRLRVIESKRKVQNRLPIFAVSADCQDSTKLLCLSAGMTHFLTKPLRQHDILNILKLFQTDSSDSR